MINVPVRPCPFRTFCRRFHIAADATSFSNTMSGKTEVASFSASARLIFGSRFHVIKSGNALALFARLLP